MGRPKGSKNKPNELKPLTRKQKDDALFSGRLLLIQEAHRWFELQNRILVDQQENVRKQQEFLEEQTKQFFERNKAQIDSELLKAAVQAEVETKEKEDLKQKQSGEPENESVEPANLAELFKPIGSDGQ